ncbi:hypothetical protein R5R35_013181 [Gryllus longicercus]|uniref:Centrosome-associated zinc finger protein CP190 n=1 Tax=Gryllus longicercus TaxID=2509291 RepID=A0AAN9YZY6_9ORTH
MNEGNVKQVKVDNWGIFFLQRLQQFFNRSEYCDLILQFSNNDQVKVHRLVLNACTEYFQTLEKQGCNVGACIIRMPADLQSEVVVPIINFMYTGRLEFRTELHTQLYAAAQQMNMTVLTKLLDAQATPSNTHQKPVPIKKPLPVTWNLQGKKIVPKQIDSDLPEPLPGRKLPIWKRRSAPTLPSYGSDSSVINHEGPSRILMTKADEVPRPTRFEWPDEDIQQTPPFTTSFDDISYETKPLVKAADRPKVPPAPPVQCQRAITSPVPPRPENRAVSFEEVRRTAVSIKRPVVVTDPNEAKKPKIVDLQAVKEYIAEHKLRKDLVDTEDSSEDVDDDLAVADMDDDDDDDMDEESEHPEGVLSGPTPSQQLNTPQKSILKSQPTFEEPVPVSTSTPVGSKKVRFSLDDKSSEGKENSSKEIKSSVNKATTVSVGSVTEPGNLSNHAKIITEVLKKYPHLVKNNKNIRLKIMQRGNQPVAPAVATETDPNKLVKSKVSYVVVKSEVAGKGKAVVLKHGGHVEPLSDLPSQQKTVSGAENTTGPWLCHTCGSNEEPVNFETYYQYRRHLQEVHMEKIDARICEHCGHRASKRNLLLYHLYTRHNIPPPRNCQFPKCDQCDYVALSESLLIKHRNNHLNNKEFICRVCNATFKSNGALQGHMQTNLHSDPSKKLYECPYCMKTFIRNINLKAHLRTAHKDFRKIDDGAGGQLDEQGLQLPLDSEDGDSQNETTGDENLPRAQVGQVMEVPVLNAVPQVKSETTQSVMLAPTMTVLAEAPTIQTLVPSSEAEALSNVASGIAASLGLADTLTGEQTVIVLDENQEFILHTTEVVREETAFTEAQEYTEESQTRSEESCPEYIVPEIIGEENQHYTGQLPNVEQYHTENSEAQTSTSDAEHCALPTNPTGAAPPTTLPSVTSEGEEIALVLSDHDYAEDTTQKDAPAPENMMFIITQPVVSVSSNTIPVVSTETTQTHVMSTLQGNGTQMAVITNAIHEGISVPVSLASPNTAVIIPAICERTNSLSEIQQSVMKVQQDPTNNNPPVLLQQNSEGNFKKATTEECVERIAESAVREAPPSEIPCPPVKQSIPVTSMPVRRMPKVEMADLVKEWDDFDEDSCDAKMEDSVVQTG